MLVIERTFVYGSSQLSKYTKYQIERPASLKYAYHIQVTFIIEVDFSQGGVFVSGREQIFAGTQQLFQSHPILFPPDYSSDLHENETFIDGRN